MPCLVPEAMDLLDDGAIGRIKVGPLALGRGSPRTAQRHDRQT